MGEQQFYERWSRILSEIEALPEPQRSALLELAEETRQRHEGIRQSAARALEALDDWRLLQKYRIFEAEAALRESQARRRKPD